jgi:hypothetical protein
MSDEVLAPYPHLREYLGGDVPLAELGPGRPVEALRAKLTALDDVTLFAGAKVKDRSLAKCCHSGLWLAFDFLDESHRISQEISTVEGSYWHGVMHRREPDYANAKYWFRRVPQHPVFASLELEAARLYQQHESSDPRAEFLEHVDGWDPLAFIDLCEAIARGKARCGQLAREVALAEWRLLFGFCYEGALG